MKAEEFVKSKYPDKHVAAIRLKTLGRYGRVYYLVFVNYGSKDAIRLSEGNTKSEAWVNAKDNITNTLQPET